MNTIKLEVPPAFETVTTEERIEFVQILWDRIAEDPLTVPVPDHHKKILDERLDNLVAETANRSWSEVREELLSDLRKN